MSLVQVGAIFILLANSYVSIHYMSLVQKWDNAIDTSEISFNTLYVIGSKYEMYNKRTYIQVSIHYMSLVQSIWRNEETALT